jgi:hypothetical protein
MNWGKVNSDDIIKVTQYLEGNNLHKDLIKCFIVLQTKRDKLVFT